jgi:hypothetical protein
VRKEDESASECRDQRSFAHGQAVKNKEKSAARNLGFPGVELPQENPALGIRLDRDDQKSKKPRDSNFAAQGESIPHQVTELLHENL